MREVDYLRQNNILITSKQYKLILIKIVLMLIIFTTICIGGGLLMILACSEGLVLTGLILFLIGIILLVFSYFYIMIKYASKIQLYRHYKKFPDDYNAEV